MLVLVRVETVEPIAGGGVHSHSMSPPRRTEKEKPGMPEGPFFVIFFKKTLAFTPRIYIYNWAPHRGGG